MIRALVVSALVCLAFPHGAAAAGGGRGASKGSDAPRIEGQEFHRLMEEGVLNNSLGRHRAAEEAFRSAVGICERRFGVDAPKCGDVINRLAMEVSNQERYREADPLFQRGEGLVRRSKMASDYPRYLTYRAMDAANRGEFELAMRFILNANKKRKALLKTAFKKARLANTGTKKLLSLALSDLAHGLYVQAGVAFRLGRIAEAKVTAHLSRKLIAKSDNAPDWWISFVDTLLAEIDLKEGNKEAAEKKLRLALKTKRFALGNTRAVALSHLALGSVFRADRRDGEAVSTMRSGLAIVRGELRQAAGIDPERLMPFLESAQAELARDPSSQRKLKDEMFAASQLVRSGQTARTVAQMAARFSAKRPGIADLVRQLQSASSKRDALRLRLGQAAISLSGKPDHKNLKKLRLAYVRAAKSVVAFEHKLRSVYPEYANLVSPAPVAVWDVAKHLGPDEGLVKFLIGENGGFAFLLLPDGLKVYAIKASRGEIETAVRRLRKPLERAGARIAEFDLRVAHSLYLKLLGPAKRELATVRHLVVVSSGLLLSVPFSLLVTESPRTSDEVNYADAAWLVRDTAVTMMPSVKAFTTLRGESRPSAAPLPFIGFGNPKFEGKVAGSGMAALADHCRTDAPAPPSLLRGLAALPKTANELERVARALGAGKDAIHLGNRATESLLHRMPLHKYRILYFATHGLLPGELRCQSEPALALSPPTEPAQDRSADGLLDASEIAGLRLDADLVVLSACNTGGGNSGKFGGEALSGLARAFFQAGARSTLVSHWQVDSTATVRLMTRLFERLAQRADGRITDALRLAQIDMISSRKTAHPFFWAAFTLVGEGRSGMVVSTLKRSRRTVKAE